MRRMDAIWTTLCLRSEIRIPVRSKFIIKIITTLLILFLYHAKKGNLL